MTIAFLKRQPVDAPEYTVAIDPDLVDAMNAWRLRQTPQLSPTEAIMALLRIALIAEGAPQSATPSQDVHPQVHAFVSAFRQALVKSER